MKRIMLLLTGLILFAVFPAAVHAATVTFTGSLEGETNPYDDYFIYMLIGDSVIIDHVCDSSTPLDPALQVLDSGGTVLASDDDSHPTMCAQSRSSRIAFTAPVTGTYTIRASSYEILYDNDTNDPNADGDYTLTITGDFSESIQVSFSGSLEGETNPFDDYIIAMNVGTVVTIDHVCDSSTPLDPALQVLDSGGTVLASDDDSHPTMCAQSRSSRIIFTAPATGTYTIRASSYEIIFDNDPTDPNADGNYTLTITGSFSVVGVPPQITSVSALTVTANTSFSHVFTASGVPAPSLTFSNIVLPPGVTLSGATLSGIPEAAGNFGVSVSATNGTGSDATQDFTLIVTGTAPTITSAGSASVLATTPFSHTFTASGNPAPSLSYSDENLPPGVNRIGNVLSGTPSTPGNYGITVTASNGVSPNASQTFTIQVTGSAPAITSVPSASVEANSAFNHTFTASGDPAVQLSYTNENLPPGVTRSGDTLSGIPTAVGSYSIDVRASNGISPDAIQVFSLMVTGDAPAITSVPSVTIEANAAFAHTFTAAGNPLPTLSYENENLPPGITRTDDTLTGAATAVGVYSIDVRASNGVTPDALQTFVINVTGDAPVFTSPESVVAVLGEPFSHTITLSGNPQPVLGYLNENLPPGVTRTDEILSGIPSALGIYTLEISASNGVSPDAFQLLTITVTGDAPVFTSVPDLTVTEWSAFSHTFTANGNPAPVLSFTSVSLPPGVTLTGNTLSGTPTQAGTYSLEVRAVNGVNPDAVQTFYLVVSERVLPPPTPLCEAHNFEEGGVVRSSLADGAGFAVNCRILYQNGAPTQWLGSDLYTGGSIGIQGVLDLGVMQAIDIFSPVGMTYFEGGAVFCLRGTGTLIWMAAVNSPRIAEIIGSYTVPDFAGYTCATLFEPGTLVLVQQSPAS